MFNLIKSAIQITILSIVFLFSTYAVIAAWSEPAGGPTGNNASTPLDVSSTGQTKIGGLILNTGAAANGLIVSAGNVGIGTTTPTSKLEVNGLIYSGLSGFKFPDGTTQASAAAAEPVGSILAYGAATAPSGWLIADGSAVSRTTYSALFAVIGISFGYGNQSTTFNLPDLRGAFIRGLLNAGTNTATTTDPDVASRGASNPGGATGNNIGSYQGDMFASHQHSVNDNHSIGLGAGPYPYGGNGGISGATGGNETRPKNVYLMYIIKY